MTVRGWEVGNVVIWRKSNKNKTIVVSEIIRTNAHGNAIVEYPFDHGGKSECYLEDHEIISITPCPWRRAAEGA